MLMRWITTVETSVQADWKSGVESPYSGRLTHGMRGAVRRRGCLAFLVCCDRRHVGQQRVPCDVTLEGSLILPCQLTTWFL